MAVDDKEWDGLDEEFPIAPAVISNVRVDREEELELSNSYYYGHQQANEMPSMIVSDWMYLGSMVHAAGTNVVQNLGITHILNCSSDIPWYTFNGTLSLQIPVSLSRPFVWR